MSVKQWSVEYRDRDGDVVVEHIWATAEEMAVVLDEMAADGLTVTAHDLSPSAVLPGGTSSAALPR